MLSQITNTVLHKFSQVKVILCRLKWLPYQGQVGLCLIFLLKIKLLQLGQYAKIAGKYVTILINSFLTIFQMWMRDKVHWLSRGKNTLSAQQMWSHFCLKCDPFGREYGISDLISSLLMCHYFKLTSPCSGCDTYSFHFSSVQ